MHHLHVNTFQEKCQIASCLCNCVAMQNISTPLYEAKGEWKVRKQVGATDETLDSSPYQLGEPLGFWFALEGLHLALITSEPNEVHSSTFCMAFLTCVGPRKTEKIYLRSSHCGQILLLERRFPRCWAASSRVDAQRMRWRKYVRKTVLS